MDADRLARAESIFHELSDAPTSERASLLARRCGDDRELREFVQRLLDHDAAELGSFLEPPASSSTSTSPDRSADTPAPDPVQIGHYEIVRRIGRGGTGTVYDAHDTRLRRSVALKVLPPGVAEHPDRLLRFQREARAVAALNHTNIVTLHSVEEAEGTHFLTMELVEGRRLSDCIAIDGMPCMDLLDVAIPVVDAVAYAHARGIIHRDLKPGNLMIASDGKPMVLDFSIAKILGATELRGSATSSDDESLTVTGGVLGTYGYTSPEQLRGDEIDQRSDIFSLGVVLYEMATGLRPFAGDSPTEIATAIEESNPTPVVDLRPELPAQLGAIIARCLEKDRGARYASAEQLGKALGEVRSDLDREIEPHADIAPGTRPRGRGRTITVTAVVVLAALVGALFVRDGLLDRRPDSESATPTTATDVADSRKRLAVLPFENLGGPGDEYFAAGVTEEITSRLAEIGGLSVVSRTSATRFAGTSKSVGEIGAELGVEYILEGTVRTEEREDGTRSVIVTPQLIEVSSDSHLWTDRYGSRVAPGEIMGVQAAVAEQVAASLNVALAEGEIEAIRSAQTSDAQAYDDFLLGRFHWHKRNPGGIELAASYFEDAVARDSGFARAYAGLADSYVLFPLYGVGGISRREAYDRAEIAARRAIELDDSLADAHTSLAVARFYGSWDFDSAEPLFQDSIRRDPEYTVARYWYGELLAATGRIDEAILQAERVVSIDPLLAVGHHLLGVWLVAAGRNDEGEARLLRAAELEPEFPYVHAELGDLYFRTGRHGEAVLEWERSGIPRELAVQVAEAATDPALQARARDALRELEGSPDYPGHLGNLGMASLYALVGDPDTAIDRLEAAYAERSEELIYLPTMTRTDPGIRLLATEARFQNLLQRLGLD